MWNKLIRYFNQNRKKVFRICIIIVSFFLVLQFLNQRVKEEKQQEYENRLMANQMGQNLVSQVGNPVENKIGEQAKVNEISQTTTTNILNEESAIKQFISYCNEGKVTEAYSMLSENCREELFQTEEQFRKNYYESKFQTKKVSSLLSWINSSYGKTYRVRLYENLLETGDNSDVAIEDYITVDKINDQYVLNINAYMGRTQLDKSSSAYGITITVRNKNVYNEYEQYNLTIQNGTDQVICLDPKENTSSTYLLGGEDKKVTYTSYIHELTEENLVLQPGEVKTFNIKFNKSFNGRDTTSAIYFSNAVLDYEGYLASQDKANYNKKVLLYVNF